jgi:hypothetical protein
MMMMMMMEATGSSENWDTSPLFCKKGLSAILSYVHLSAVYRIIILCTM